MYGLVNQAVQDLVVTKFGEKSWQDVLERSGVKETQFISSQSYPDQTTYDLATAASEVLGISLKDVLIAFGEWWVLDTAQKKYGHLLKSGGPTLRDFLLYLPRFHSSVEIIYPDLKPPEFEVEEAAPGHIILHYFSDRPGLTWFVYGLIQGLGAFHSVEVTIEIRDYKDHGADHDVFIIRWDQNPG
ncbi:MAG: heme NO-binding domain-containing protein [Verrucomicrobia bacterium]|nr:heme NO-binding domain-containing protein [Verrucomicrobiota bacterium]